MLLKHLINPKPTIILFFSVSCLFFVLIPLFESKLSVVFSHYFLNPIILLISAVLIPFFLSVGLNNLVYEKNIIKKDNLVVGAVFILISSSFYNHIDTWVSAFILLFFFNFLVDSYQKEYPFSQLFNASLILSSLTLVFPNLAYLSFLFITNGIVFSHLNWRMFITIILGLLTPYLFYFGFTFLTEKHFIIPDFFNINFISFNNLLNLSLSKKIWIIILLIIIIFSFFELFLWLYKKSIKSRKIFITTFWYFIISLFIACCSNVNYFYFTLTPLTIIIGNYFVYSKKRKIANILFFLLVISSSYYKYMIAINV